MKSKLLFSLILAAGLIIFNFSVSNAYGQTPQDKVVSKKTVKYTCPMHPEVVQDAPGKCPKCGTKLEVKKDVQTIAAPKAKEPLNEKKDVLKEDTTSVKKQPKL